MKPRLAGILLLAIGSSCGWPASLGAADALVTATPFAARSGPRGATMFTELPASATGIVTENKYNDPRMWWERYREFMLGAIGTGVAVGDYDNDGRPDLFVVSKVEGHRLFRNLGDWKFEDVTDAAGLSAPPGGDWEQGATWADVDNDGDLDLYVCRFAAPNLLYINQGNGTFIESAAAAGLAVNDASAMAAFADYDRDGWLDVYILTNVLDFNHDREGRPDYLFHNNGDGTFTDVTASAGIEGPGQGHSTTWWDYDDDGWPDLYVANDFVPADVLYHNEHNGRFRVTLSGAVPHTPNSSMGADVGDFDGDGRLDLYVADMAATTHEKDQRGMVDGRAESTDWPDDPEVARQVPRGALFLNTGTGRCLEAAELAGLAATDWTWAVRCEDFDNDGREDLFVTTGMVRELHNTDLMAATNRATTPQERIRLVRESPVFAESNLAFRNDGDLRFERVETAWGLDRMGVSFGAATGDFDGDGDLDLVCINLQGGVTVWRNDVDHGHSVTFALRGTESNRFGVGAIVRIETASGAQVRQLTLARGYSSSSEPILHFGLGADERIDRVTINWPDGPVQELHDLPAGQRYTVTEPRVPIVASILAAVVPKRPAYADVAPTTGLDFSNLESPLDETANQPLLPRRFNRCGPQLAIGDLNGDGRDDVIIGGTVQSPAHVLLADREILFRNIDSLLVFARSTLNDGPILMFDADGDGRNDVLMTAGGVAEPADSPEYQPQLLLNQGDAFFKRAPADALPSLPIVVGAAATADFDHDGRPDVFLGGRVIPGHYPLPPRSALLANRGGHFEDVTRAIAPDLDAIGLVTAALWCDVDGDTWPDLLVALEWGGVRYLHNVEGKHFEDRSEAAGFTSAGTGWWTALATADFNEDGRPDFVAGNVGLNTPYAASPEHPAVLFLGAFEDGVSPQLIEGYYEGDRLFPRRGRKQLGAVIPSVAKRFPRSNDFARATLEEILGADRLAAARRFAATELRSGVFLSGPDGRYTFTPLPRIAQIAPLAGIVAGDFDGDGHADIYAVQNSHAAIPSVGRFDGGLSQLLQGDGHGGFRPVPIAESGLIVPGDARAVAALDANHDGRTDFLVTRNRDPFMIWLRSGTEDKLAASGR